MLALFATLLLAASNDDGLMCVGVPSNPRFTSVTAPTFTATSAFIANSSAVFKTTNNTTNVSNACGFNTGDECNFTNAIGATAANTTTPAFKFYHTNGALDSTDLLVDFGDNASSKFKVDASGNATAAGGVKATTYGFPGVSQLLTKDNVTTNDMEMNANVANSAANSAVSFGNQISLTAGQDRYIASFFNDSLSTAKARVFSDGTYSNIGATAGTAGSGTGITTGYTSAVRQWVHKQTIDRTALTAAATTDLTVWTTLTNTRLTRVFANVTQVFTGGALSAMTFQCGKSAGTNEYLVGGSVFAAQTTLGDVQAEIGAGLLSATLADMGTPAAGVPGAIAISCRFTCTGANCSVATQGSLTLYIEGVTY